MTPNDVRQVMIEPIISYPREAQAGKSYLMTIDLRMLTSQTEWPYDDEEYPISFVLDTMPLFSYESVGDEDPSVILHRFGGTYGPATYLLKANEREMSGNISVTLVNEWGIPIEQITVKSTISAAGTIQSAILNWGQRLKRPTPQEMPARVPSDTVPVADEDFFLDNGTAIRGISDPEERIPTAPLSTRGQTSIYNDFIGRVIKGRYKLLHERAQGSFAIVYIARDLMDNSIYAVKVFHPELSYDKDLLARFQREANFLLSLRDSHIVRVLDYGSDDNLPFVVMDYIDGQNLKYHILTRGSMELPRALDYVLQITKGLDAAYKQGVVHPDIKPQNILINNKGVVKITDFGLARNLETHTQSAIFLGTAHYISPEQVKSGQLADIRSNLYSLATIFFEMLTGDPPFEGETVVDIALRHMNEKVPSVSRTHPGLSADIDRFIQKAMAKAPADRFQTPQEFIAALETLQQLLPASDLTTAVEDKQRLDDWGPSFQHVQDGIGSRPGIMIGKVIGKYLLLEERDQGSFATIYTALDRDNNIYAVKIMHPELANDQELISRFQREAQILSKLSDPHIVRFVESGNDNNVYYIVMEYIDGQNLKYHILTSGPIEPLDALYYTRQVAEVLDTLYKNGTVHRGITPRDIHINNNGIVKIVDFGLARDSTSVSLTQPNVFMGTAYYISPEQADSGHLADTRSDLYSVAAVLFEMLAGHPPFEGDRAIDIVMKHMNEKVPSICRLRPGLPPEMDIFFQKALAKTPADRYQTPQAFIEALDRVQSIIPQNQHFPVPVMSANIGSISHQGICPYCGADTREGDNFCLNCGNRLPGTSATTISTTTFDPLRTIPAHCPHCKAGTVLKPGTSECLNCGNDVFATFAPQSLPFKPTPTELTWTTFIGLDIGDYQVIEEISRGLNSRVYLAHRKLFTDELVAIKILSPIWWEGPELFQQEVQMMKALHHPHILAILDFGLLPENISSSSLPYIVTEYASNGTLQDRIKRLAPSLLSLQDSVEILYQVGQAVDYIHQRNIIHRDIKPSNILFNARNDALLGDFGIATIDPSKNQDAVHVSTLGTPLYMSPEQIEGTVSQKSDQYSLGCVAYELLTEHPPFAGSDYVSIAMGHLTEKPTPPRQLNPSIPIHIEQAILQALAKKPDNRHVDVLTFVRALRQGSLHVDKG
jgi:serine/threonine protein kinase